MKPQVILAQINLTVGDIAGNVARMADAARPYAKQPQALVVFPELSITGYPPEDLVLREHFVDDTMQAMYALAKRTISELPAMIVGGLYKQGTLVFNAAFVLAHGEIIHIHCKSILPNYGIFDEKRLFARGSAPIAFELFGMKMGLLLCEDSWFDHNFRLLQAQAAEHIIIINASPFEQGKHARRLDMYSARAAKFQVPISYINLVGGQDDIIFDGCSFQIDAEGKIQFQAPAFVEYVGNPDIAQSANADVQPMSAEEECWQAIVLGIRDYVKKNGFSSVLLGLSGGLDSAVVAALAADALGSEHVLAVLLPSAITSDESNADAKQCAELLHIKTITLPISPAVEALDKELIPALTALHINTDSWRSNLMIGGNIQSRLRGLHLMSISNATGALLLNTSNKSELAVGYSTLYGDSCGAYAPIKDVYKTQIYALAKWRNRSNRVIPEAILDKAPTAELAPNQKDSDQLPEYDVLDAILKQFIDEKKSIADVIESGVDAALANKIWTMLKRAEYKRRQSPPGAKVSSSLFNRDWRYPLTNGA